jgi:hypothetical protein
VRIVVTAAQASDILDDLRNLDGMWSATFDLREALELIVLENQAVIWPPARTMQLAAGDL